MKAIARLTLGAMLLVMGPAAAQAQAVWMEADHARSISLEVLRPDLAGGRYTIPTNASFLTVRLPIGARTLVVLEQPFAYAGLQERGSGGSRHSATLGNAYVGLEHAIPEGHRIEVGARLPMRGEFNEEDLAHWVGLFSDPVERFGAFFPDLLELSSHVSSRIPAGALSLVVRGGPSLWIDTGDDRFRDRAELFMGYGAYLTYQPEAVRVGAGIGGRAILTEEGSLSERAVHQFGANASVRLGRFEPGIQLRIPIEERWRRSVSHTLGISLRIRQD